MKPRNFPMRKARRVARALLRKGLELPAMDRRVLTLPTDIRIRMGREARQ